MCRGCNLPCYIKDELFRYNPTSFSLQTFGKTGSGKVSNEPRRCGTTCLDHCFGIVRPGKVRVDHRQRAKNWANVGTVAEVEPLRSLLSWTGTTDLCSDAGNSRFDFSTTQATEEGTLVVI